MEILFLCDYSVVSIEKGLSDGNVSLSPVTGAVYVVFYLPWSGAVVQSSTIRTHVVC